MPDAITPAMTVTHSLAQTLAALEPLTQFGVAGLMGTLWVWERYLSRNREHQLTEAHQLIRDERKQLAILIDLVHQNTQALHRVELATAHLERAADLHHTAEPRPSHPDAATRPSASNNTRPDTPQPTPD
ncbi:MAG: hypothetical protein AAF750_03395 [Planctomycetota bacterium]